MSAELETVAKLTDGLAFGSDVWLGPGDDAAVLVPRGDIVIATDMLIENVRSKYAWPFALRTGRKAVVANISDVEAMGAKPSAVVIGSAFPRNLDRCWISDFQEGVAKECVRIRVSPVESDLSSSAHIVLGVTALGNLPGRPAVTQAGTRAGDQVTMCGQLGYSADDPLILQRGFGSPKGLVLEQRCPTVPYGRGKVAAGANAIVMIDVSDGLLQDLGHICELFGAGIDVRTGALKIHNSLTRLAAATGKDPLGFVLAGGEDHALVTTFPAEVELPQGRLRVGTVVAGAEVIVDGMPWTGSVGQDHFAWKENQ